MIRHLFVATLRNMAANRLLSAIAIVGLGIGIAALLTVVSLVRGLSTWDQFVAGHERTFLVTMPATRPGLPYSFNSDPRIAGLLKLALPEIESVTRLSADGGIMRHGNVVATERISWADPGTFDVLPLPAYRGSLQAALATPDSLVVSRGIARKYFGRDDIVGESIELGGRPRIVRAVIEDLPTQTELRSIFLSNLSPDGDVRLKAGPDAEGPDGGISSYVRLKPGADIEAIRQRAHDAIRPVLAGRPFKGSGPDAGAPLLLRIDRGIWSDEINPGFRTALALGTAIGLLLLFLGSVNFVNMMTARAARRATEVSVRKVCGADRPALMLQFLGESILVVFFSTCAALALNEWLLGRINGLGQALPLDFWRDPALLGGLLLGIVLLGTAAGAWPALVLSSFRPRRVLKGLGAEVGRAGIIRSGLVALQFAVLVGFTIAALVIYQQHRFAVSRPLGLDLDRLLMLDAECRPALVDALRRLPGIAGVACTGDEFFTNNATVAFAHRGANVTLDMVRSDRNAFALYGVPALAGPLPSAAATENESTPGVVLNQLAARKLGYASPQAAIGQVLTGGELAGRRVTAVVRDFALYSLERPLEPTVFVPMALSSIGQRISIKLGAGDIGESLAAIDRAWTASGKDGPAPRTFLDQRLEEQYVFLLQNANLFALSALVAVFLGCLGLTGLTIASAERRTKEIGVRKAMGATVAQIVALLLWQFSRPVLWANLAAWPVAWYAMRQWLSGFAYHVELNWWVFLAASLAALAVALATVAGQAWVTARQKPVLALRYE
jgi:putative ABC transport system permease protein